MTSTEGDIWPDDFPLVVSGHIHDSQWLQKNIYYVGSSMQHAFGESADKTIALFTFEKKKKFELQKINLEMKKKKIVYLTIDKAKKYKPPENVHIKIVVKGTSNDIKVFRSSKDYKNLQKLGLVITFQFNQTEKMEIVKAEKKNILEILKELIKNENIYVKKEFEKIK